MSEFFSLIDQFPYFGLFVLPILGSMGLPVPEDAILIFCGVLISKNSVVPFPAIVAVYAGILMSDLLIYAFGKRYCRRLVTHKIFKKILSPEKFILLEHRFTRSGPFLILLGRQFFWLRAKLFLVAGIMKMPIYKFLFTDAIAALFTAGIMVTLGYTGEKYLRYFNSISSRIDQTTLITVCMITTTSILCGLLILRHRKIVKVVRIQEG